MKYKYDDLVTVEITWCDHYCEDHVENFLGRYDDVRCLVRGFDTRIRQNPDFLNYVSVRCVHTVSLM